MLCRYKKYLIMNAIQFFNWGYQDNKNIIIRKLTLIFSNVDNENPNIETPILNNIWYIQLIKINNIEITETDLDNTKMQKSFDEYNSNNNKFVKFLHIYFNKDIIIEEDYISYLGFYISSDYFYNYNKSYQVESIEPEEKKLGIYSINGYSKPTIIEWKSISLESKFKKLFKKGSNINLPEESNHYYHTINFVHKDKRIVENKPDLIRIETPKILVL